MLAWDGGGHRRCEDISEEQAVASLLAEWQPSPAERQAEAERAEWAAAMFPMIAEARGALSMARLTKLGAGGDSSASSSIGSGREDGEDTLSSSCRL